MTGSVSAMARGNEASRGIRGGGRPLRPAVAVATVAGVGTVGLIAAAVRPAWRVSYHPFSQAPLTPPTPAARPSAAGMPTAVPRTVPSGHAVPAGWLLMIALGVVFLLLALAVFLWWRTGRRQRPVESVDVVEPEVLTPLPALRAGVAEAERRLLGDTDPTNAIIVAWLALEEAAAGSGVRRRPSQTPTEFTLGVVEGTGVDPAPVHALLRLYHRARFSVVGSPPADLAAARRCVSELAAGWQSFSLDSEPLVLPDGTERGAGGRW